MTLGQDFFDTFYGDKPDPWGFGVHWYEERKRQLVLAALPDRRYDSAMEVGCSTGLLTVGLAARATELDAIDLAPAAVERAAAATADLPGVSVTHLDLQDTWPRPVYDLVVLSEVLYYLSPADLARFLDGLPGRLAPDAVVVTVCWRHPVSDHVQLGDDVADAAAAVPGLRLLGRWLDEDVRLDVLQAGGRPSVAARDGLA